MRKFFLIFIILISPVAIAASDPIVMDLEAAFKTAEENSPELIKAELSLQSALRTHETSWNTFLPNISLSGTFSGSDTVLAAGSGIISPWSLSGGISLNLQLSPSAAFSVEADRLDYELELLTYQQSRIDLFAKIEKAYYALITRKSSLAIEEANLQLAQKRWEQSRTNFSYGLVSELTVLQAEVSAANLKPSYNQSVQNYEVSKQNFLMLLGLNPATQITLDGSLPEYPSDLFLNTAFLIRNNIPLRFDIRSMNLQKAVLENRMNLTSTSARAPSVGLSAGYTDSLGNLFNSTAPVFTDRASMSLTLSIPVDDWIPGSAADTSILNYQDSIKQAEISIKQLAQSAETEILNIVSNIYTLQDTIELSELSLQLARRSYEMTEESFSKGRTERLNVEDAQQSLRQAEQQLLLSRSNLISSLIDLRIALNIESTDYLLENN